MQLTCPSEQQLHAFQVGDLPEAALNDIAEHLESCSRCEFLAQKLDSAQDAVLCAIHDPAGIAANDPSSATAETPVFRAAVQADELGRLGDYRILHLLGRGGMGFVYLAEDVALRRRVALKVLRPTLCQDAEIRERFFREARILASIKHVNLVTVFQAGQEGPTVYLAMDLLEGETLEQRIRRTGPPPLPEVLRLAREITHGLAAVHRHGLIHRDVKPSNIWLEGNAGRVKIMDFGLARFVNDRSNLTQPGMILGTPSFMSPEQARGNVVDARTDLFSLGCVLYWLSSGVKPFGCENTMQVLTQLATSDPRPLREVNPLVSPEFSELVMQMLSRSPDLRPACAEDVLAQLRTLRISSPPVADLQVPAKKRSGKALPVAVGLVVLAFAVWAVIASGVGRMGPVESTAAELAPVYLNDLPVVESESWPFGGPVPGPTVQTEPSDWPPPLGGYRVWADGKPSPHGVWMHLPHGDPKKSSVSFRLDRQFRSFRSDVSLGDGPRDCDPLTFSVYADGELLWKSRPVQSSKDRQSSPPLSVVGVERLTLEVSGEGEERGSHAVWIEPFLTSKPERRSGAAVPR